MPRPDQGYLSALDEELKPGTLLSGRYKVEQRIGVGGMGAVYAALDLTLSRKVAIKLISRHHTNEPRQVARFRREAEVASRIDHPHVVRVFDVGQAAGREYLSMEFLEGVDLFDAIQLVGTYEPADAITILDQALQALEAAHALGLVHRDLKPENIYLAQSESGEINVKLLDFGVVKVMEEGGQKQLTRTGTVVGTPEYMSPEQASSGTVDARSDLYALGCIAMAMLCGRPPFVNKSVLLVMTAHVGETPRKPSEIRADLKAPAAIDAFVLKALEKSPDKRYQSAAEMRAALKRLAAQVGAEPAAGRITLPPGHASAATMLGSTIRGTPSPLSQEPPPAPPPPVSTGTVEVEPRRTSPSRVIWFSAGLALGAAAATLATWLAMR